MGSFMEGNIFSRCWMTWSLQNEQTGSSLFGTRKGEKKKMVASGLHMLWALFHFFFVPKHKTEMIPYSHTSQPNARQDLIPKS